MVQNKTMKLKCMFVQGRILGGGAHLPWDGFALVLKFSAPPLRTFVPHNINEININEINLKRQLYKLD